MNSPTNNGVSEFQGGYNICRMSFYGIAGGLPVQWSRSTVFNGIIGLPGLARSFPNKYSRLLDQQRYLPVKKGNNRPSAHLW